MSLAELFSAIESPQFGLKLTASSGFSVVKMVLGSDETVQQLIDELRVSPETSKHVYEHLLTLLADNDEPEFMHEHDEALTAYLFVLSKSNTELTSQAVDKAIHTPNLWWARRLAEELQHIPAENR
jgi:hypothetical protein